MGVKQICDLTVQAVNNLRNKNVSKFVGDERTDGMSHNEVVSKLKVMSLEEIILALLGFVLFFAIHLLLAKWLWNAVLPKLIPAINPATSVWQLLGLTILLSLLNIR